MIFKRLIVLIGFAVLSSLSSQAASIELSGTILEGGAPKKNAIVSFTHIGTGRKDSTTSNTSGTFNMSFYCSFQAQDSILVSFLNCNNKYERQFVRIDSSKSIYTNISLHSCPNLNNRVIGGQVKENVYGSPLPLALVELYELDVENGDLNYVSTSSTNQYGEFEFTNKSNLSDSGFYILRGLPLLVPKAIHVTNGYHGGSTWENAALIRPMDTTIRNVTFMLPAAFKPQGDHVIHGKISFSPEKANTGNLPVRLTTKAGDPMSFAFTDTAGSFHFENIPTGDYLIHLDVPGVPATPALVTIDSKNSSPQVQFMITDVNVYPLNENGEATSITSEKIVTLRAYPNPFAAELILSLPIEMETTVRITNISGVTVFEEAVKGEEKIKSSAWPEGIYIVEWSNHKTTLLKQ